MLSAISNLLMLTGPLFMLQVYDRVIPSRSVPTLVSLVVIVAVLFAFYGVIEVIRSRIVGLFGNLTDRRFRSSLFRAALRLKLAGSRWADADPLGDSDLVRTFVSNAGILAFLDLPWVPIYVAIIFVIHPILGWVAVAGVLVTVFLMVLNELLARSPEALVHRLSRARRDQEQDVLSNAETVAAMGMSESLNGRWEEISVRQRRSQLGARGRSATIISVTKSLRFFLQSGILAIGASLVLDGHLSSGLMIAASVITARALAPAEQVVANWKPFLSARRAWKRIAGYLQVGVDARPITDLPDPAAELEVRGGSIAIPGENRVAVGGLSFHASAGDVVGVIGPSGSGKTVLARALVGAWATHGEFRLDGAALDQWADSRRSGFIGYLPQRIELFGGTVAENIARFDPDVESEAVIAAARLADVHDLVLSLPEGYDTQIGDHGVLLSGGQRQRIALARAAYKNPFLVVLDEPNSNLDRDGELALKTAIEAMKDSGALVILIGHRPSTMEVASHLLVLESGRQVAFGIAADILANGPVKASPRIAGVV